MEVESDPSADGERERPMLLREHKGLARRRSAAQAVFELRSSSDIKFVK